MMTKKRSIATCVAEIKKLNWRFRRLADKDSSEADRLRRAKDALIDEMATLCAHPKVLASPGGDDPGPMNLSLRPRRICVRCGHCEFWDPDDDDGDLTGKPTTMVAHDAYLLQEGAVIKKLGINL